MKLPELIDAVVGELKAAGLEETGASLSLAFSAKKELDGTVSCRFIECGTLSRPTAGELHRLEVTLAGNREEEESVRPPDAEPAVPVFPRTDRTGNDDENLDSPAIFRVRLAQDLRA